MNMKLQIPGSAPLNKFLKFEEHLLLKTEEFIYILTNYLL